MCNFLDKDDSEAKKAYFNKTLFATDALYQLDDNWTIVTEDYSPSAHFEHTIAITKDGYEILTGE